MNIEIKNNVLAHMSALLKDNMESLQQANALDLAGADQSDLTIYDRLKIDNKKMDGMIQSLKDTIDQPDPVGQEKYHYHHPQGMEIYNRTAPFGTILIIYESRPDVTLEAAALAFKAGNKILLKGGKEARNSNIVLVDLWRQALMLFGIDQNYIQYLDYSREQTMDLLQSSNKHIDLVVPRGGDQLIAMVKKYSSAPVLVSGRGNNFIYIHAKADLVKAIEIILNSKLHKISVCNAADKILIDRGLPNREEFTEQIITALHSSGVEIMGDQTLARQKEVLNIEIIRDEAVWYEEFLAKKILFAEIDGLEQAINKINQYSGHHTAVIVTEDDQAASRFMEDVDAASVIHNASSRYTDGGQFGLGAELAISTDKLHHRGPLGLNQLVTNKWYVYGNGQVRG